MNNSPGAEISCPIKLEVKPVKQQYYALMDKEEYIPLIEKHWSINTAMLIIWSGKCLYTPTHTFKLP